MTDQAVMKAAAVDECLQEDLRKVCDKMIKQQNAKNLGGVMAAMHESSPWRETTKSFLEPFFDNFTLQNTVLEHYCVGRDVDFAYCRLRQKVEKIAGPEFQDIISDNLLAYRRQGQDWKVWNQMILAVELL